MSNRDSYGNGRLWELPCSEVIREEKKEKKEKKDKKEKKQKKKEKKEKKRKAAEAVPKIFWVEKNRLRTLWRIFWAAHQAQLLRQEVSSRPGELVACVSLSVGEEGEEREERKEAKGQRG